MMVYIPEWLSMLLFLWIRSWWINLLSILSLSLLLFQHPLSMSNDGSSRYLAGQIIFFLLFSLFLSFFSRMGGIFSASFFLFSFPLLLKSYFVMNITLLYNDLITMMCKSIKIIFLLRTAHRELMDDPARFWGYFVVEIFFFQEIVDWFFLSN